MRQQPSVHITAGTGQGFVLVEDVATLRSVSEILLKLISLVPQSVVASGPLDGWLVREPC